MGPPIANSTASNVSAFGVLKLTLHAGSYDWEFVAADGYRYQDSGSGSCHSAPPADTTRPSAPSGLTASAVTANQADLSWTAGTDNVGVKNYNIYRGSGGATPTLLATTTTAATSHTDTTVTASTAYSYQVQAIDAAGNLSQLSGVASVTTPAAADTEPPTVPTGLASEEVAYNRSTSADHSHHTERGQRYKGTEGPGSHVHPLATKPGTGPGTTTPGHHGHTSSTYQYWHAYDGANNESALSIPITVATPAGPSSRTFTFAPTGDATVDQTNPTRTAGTSTALTADNSPVDDFLLKFKVATSGCISLTSAILRLTNNANSSPRGGDFYTTGSNWAEGTVNWGNAPTRGALLNSLWGGGRHATVTVDVPRGRPSTGRELRFGSSTTTLRSVQGAPAADRPQLTGVSRHAADPDTTAPTARQDHRRLSVAARWLQWPGYRQRRGHRISSTGRRPAGEVSADALSYQDTAPSASNSYSTWSRRDAAERARRHTASAPPRPAPGLPRPPTWRPRGGGPQSASLTTTKLHRTATLYRGVGGALTRIRSSASSSVLDSTVPPARHTATP